MHTLFVFVQLSYSSAGNAESGANINGYKPRISLDVERLHLPELMTRGEQNVHPSSLVRMNRRKIYLLFLGCNKIVPQVVASENVIFTTDAERIFQKL